jgi:hypothetical protein
MTQKWKRQLYITRESSVQVRVLLTPQTTLKTNTNTLNSKEVGHWKFCDIGIIMHYQITGSIDEEGYARFVE